jgi:glycosyltransferase involved in cell wall biosynthesis
LGINKGKAHLVTPALGRFEIAEEYNAIRIAELKDFKTEIERLLYNTKEREILEQNARKYTAQFNWKQFAITLSKYYEN